MLVEVMVVVVVEVSVWVTLRLMVTLWVAVDVVWKEDVDVLVAVLVTVWRTAVMVVWGTPAQEHALRYLSSVPHTALKAAFTRPRLAMLGSFEEEESRGT